MNISSSLNFGLAPWHNTGIGLDLEFGHRNLYKWGWSWCKTCHNLFNGGLEGLSGLQGKGVVVYEKLCWHISIFGREGVDVGSDGGSVFAVATWEAEIYENFNKPIIVYAFFCIFYWNRSRWAQPLFFNIIIIHQDIFINSFPLLFSAWTQFVGLNSSEVICICKTALKGGIELKIRVIE